MESKTKAQSAAELRRKSLGRVLRYGGGLAAAVVVAGAAAHGAEKQTGVNANQVRDDKKALSGTIFAPKPKNNPDIIYPSMTAAAQTPPASEAISIDQSANPDAGSADAAPAIPAEGDWTPTPNASSAVAPESPGTTQPDTQASPADTPDNTGGVAPDTAPPAGGLQP